VTPSWTAQFRLSITRALADQLATALEPLTPVPLTDEFLKAVEPRPGVYVLYLHGERVYVGKASISLQERLAQHKQKLSGRVGLSSDSVHFVCVYVDEDLDAAAPEKLLIKKYRATDSIPWNTNGFGNKDPGRNRDRSLVKAKHFDAAYPIDLETVVYLHPGRHTAARLLEIAKRELPYNLRFENKGTAKKTLERTLVTFRGGTISARDLMWLIISALPSGWQATALPGYLILYHETNEYESARVWWRRDPDGNVLSIVGPQRYEAGEVPGNDVDPEASDSDETLL